MAKKPISKKQVIKKAVSVARHEVLIKKKDNKLLYILAGIIFSISFIFYASSINNEYALDDGIVMEKNEYVHKGFDGIKDIMTKDAFSSFFKQLGSSGQLSGGRYRPLSIVTFAIEYELFGFHKGDQITVTGTDGIDYKGKITKIAYDEVLGTFAIYYISKEFGSGQSAFTAVHEFKSLAHKQHFFNVLLFSISMVVLFIFLYKVLFRKLNYKEYWALFVTLVFAMHPIHSEVVANIKSRDEILSLLFILCTLIQFNKFYKKANFLNGLLMTVCFFLAMLSKEYGVVLLIIVPVWVYIEQKKIDLLKIFICLLPLLLAFLPYYLLRDGAVMVADPKKINPDVLNDYYLFAVGDEMRATQIFVLIKYFLLQLYPFPLASDYSFKTISYRHFSSPEVMVSIVFHLGLIGAAIYSILKKHLIFSFAILYYFLNLMLVGNLIFNIGASMGERLVYNSSLGLIIAIFYVLYLLTEKVKDGKTRLYIGGALVGIVVIPFFVITQQRCAAWKNDFTLAITDVKTNSNSALLNANAGTYLINRSELPENKEKQKEMAIEARNYILKALQVHPVMANGWMNLAVIEHKLNNFEASEIAVNKAFEIFPSNPKIPILKNMVSNDYVNLGFEKYKEGKIDTCFYFLYKAKQVAPFNPEAYYNLGGAYLSVAKNLDSAEFYFRKTLEMSPGHKQATDGLNSFIVSRGAF